MTSSVKLNIDTSSMNDMNMNNFGKNTISWRVGSRTDPKPTKLGIINIDEALDGYFWEEGCEHARADRRSGKKTPALRPVRKCCKRLDKLRENLRKALTDYPEFKGIKPPKGYYYNDVMNSQFQM